jgi:hypothetical protein
LETGVNVKDKIKISKKEEAKLEINNSPNNRRATLNNNNKIITSRIKIIK